MPPCGTPRIFRGINMRKSRYSRGLQAAFMVIVMDGCSSVARADVKNYEFQVVDQAIKAGPDRVITVRLVNKATGQPVPNAVIFATRLDMAPDGMQEMTTKVTPMPGGWQLSLGAKVQGETGTVENKIVIKAEK